MKIVITRAGSQSSEMIEELIRFGHDPIAIPTIQIEAISPNPRLKVAMKFLHLCKWVVFTSTNAVHTTLENITRQRYRQIKKMNIAAVGEKTAEALLEYKLNPTFVPTQYTGLSILDGLGDVNGQWIFLPRVETAREELTEAIRAAGGICLDVPVYRNSMPSVDTVCVESLRGGVDMLTFTSPSTVRNFGKICQQHNLDPIHLPGDPAVIGIGPVTEAAAKELGYKKILIPPTYTTRAMIEMIDDYQRSNNGATA